MESFRPNPNHAAFASHLQEYQRKYQLDIVNGLAVPRKLLGGESNYSSSSRGVPPLHSVMLAIVGIRRYQAALMCMARAMAAFALAIVSPPKQESAYLVHHKRLPGSLRTARLRKKRRTRVENWYRQIKKRSSL